MAIAFDVVLLVFLAITALALLRVRNLFVVVLLAGLYSLFSAGLFTVMDAVDVAMTEAAVGAGIATVLLLGTLALVGASEAPPKHARLLPLVVVIAIGAMLVYGTLDMPPYGGPNNPAQVHVAPHYLAETPREVGIANVVSAVLASYRGYDTLGETVVVFTAVIGVLGLLGGGRRTGSEDREELPDE